MAEPASGGTLTARLRSGLAAGLAGPALRLGGADLSYESVHATALALAGAVIDSGREPPARVGILAGATATAYTGIVAAIYAGAAAVPLNPDFPPARTARMIQAAGLDVVIADDRGAAVLASLAGTAMLPEVRCVTAAEHPPAAPLPEPRPVRPSDLAYVMFTSGSTGRPKGVPITHANVAHFLDCAQARYQLEPGDVLAQTFESTFDLFMFGLFMAWSTGATLVAAPPAAMRKLPSFVAENGITLWFSVPSAIRLARKLGRLTPGSLPSLTRSLFCGEPLTSDDAAAWQAAAPGSMVHNLYGPTELTIACTASQFTGCQQRSASGLVPIGRPHDGLRYLLIDPDLRPAGSEGELCVTGPQLFGGYLDPADDAGRFVEHDDARWYRTGDRVRLLPGGELDYVGRLDQQAKVRGYRVELLEIEHALRQLDGVTDCAVITVTRDGETELAALYSGDQAVEPRLPRQLAAELPGYMIPATIRHLAELPLTSNGKVDRLQLADWASGPSMRRV